MTTYVPMTEPGRSVEMTATEARHVIAALDTHASSARSLGLSMGMSGLDPRQSRRILAGADEMHDLRERLKETFPEAWP